MERLTRFWRGRRALVTGATGIVGCWLVKELLARGAQVSALVLDADLQSELYRSGDVDRIAVVNGKLESFSVCERALSLHGPDTVFHLGAQTIVGAAQRRPWATFETNIRGTYNLLEACRLVGVNRIVVASSDKAYGEQRLPYVETMPLEGRHPYEVSKSCADLLAQSYHHAYGLPVAIARCGNVFGGGDLNWSRIVPGTIRSLLAGERPVLRSDGRYVRDYIYVKDVARAYIRLAEGLDDERVPGQAFNFSAERPMTVSALVAALQNVMGTRLKPIVENNARGEIRHQKLSAAKARRLLGWRPSYQLDDALRETVDWYSAYFKST